MDERHLTQLEAQLDAELHETFLTAAKRNFKPVRFLEMLKKLGGVQTVTTLLGSGETDIAEGLIRLYELQLLDVSAEAVMLSRSTDLCSMTSSVAWPERACKR